MDRSDRTGLAVLLVLFCYVSSVQTQYRGLMTNLYYEYFEYSGDPKCQLRHISGLPPYDVIPGELRSGTVEPTTPILEFPNPTSLMKSLAVDYRTNSVYMYDLDQSAIAIIPDYNEDLDMDATKIRYVKTAVSKADGVHLAMDWVSHTIYWTDPIYRRIDAAPGQYEKIDMDYYITVVQSHLDKPSGIAIDPIEGVLCWSDAGTNPKIECSNLMGKKRKKLASRYLMKPAALEMDLDEQLVYWIDLFTDTVLSVPYDGDFPKSVTRIPRTSFFEMSIFREALYISDPYDGYLYILNKTSGAKISETITMPPYDPYGVSVYSEETQPMPDRDYCADKNCDHLCITEKDGAQCVCSQNYVLDEQSGKCKEYPAGFHKAVVFANITHICLVDIRAFSSSNFNVKCVYSVYQKQQDMVNTPPSARRKRQAGTFSTSDPAMPSTSTTSTTTSTTTTTPPPTTRAPKPTTTSTPAPTTRAPTTTSTSTTTTSTTTTTTATTTTTIPTTTTPPVPPGDYITNFDLDMERRILFFATAEGKIYARPIDTLIENDAKELLVTASANVTGLAYDAGQPSRLYWSQTDGYVWFVDTTSQSVERLNSTINDARNIIVLLNKNKVAMLSGTEEARDVSIKTLTTDGKEVLSIVSGKSSIEAFTYDSDKELFYYISGRYVYRASLDGLDSGVEFFGVDNNAFLLVLYRDYLTWVFTNDTHMHALKTRDMQAREITELGKFDDSDIVDLKVLDVALQTPTEISPCAYGNGGCHQICITSYLNDKMVPECECRIGYTLVDDICETQVVPDFFLLLTDWTHEEILQVDLATDDVHIVPGDESSEYMGLIYDNYTDKVMFAEYFSSEIEMVSLNGTDRQLLVDLGFDGYAYRFDMDFNSGYLYFTAYYDTFLGLATPFGEYIKLEGDFGWDALGDIVVYPEMGWMYYTVTGWLTDAYIGRSNMDGSQAIQLITGDHVDFPDGLALDYINQRLFWSDATYDTIQQCNLDGMQCETIVNKTATNEEEQIRDLETDGEYLYYCSYLKDYIVRVELKKPYKAEIVGQNYGLGRLDTMAFYYSQSQNIQKPSQFCYGDEGLGDCSTICIPIHNDRVCECENGITLKPDGRTCSNIFQCKDVIYQTVELSTGVEETIEVTMDKSCNRYVDSECKYKCPVNFEALFDTVLTCTKVGWNRELDTLCREIKCPQTIANGILENTCKREIGEKCDYECKANYVKTAEKAVCTKTGTYHRLDSDLCAPFNCTDKIGNGKLDMTCNRTIGNSCKFTCDKFYTSKVATSMATCQAGGWSPSPETLCEESLCDENSLSNGLIIAGCPGKIGEGCSFQCNQGYEKTTDVTFCRSDKMWHPTDSCTPYLCPATIDNGMLDENCARTVGSSCDYTCKKYYTPSVKKMKAVCNADGWSPSSADLCAAVQCPTDIPNGEITGDCDFTIGSTCNFKCNDGYTPSDLHPNITCKFEGVWFTDKLCLVPPKKKFELSVPGVAAGLAILAVLVLVLVVVLVCLIRRQKSSSYDTFDDRAVALDNPGYAGRKESSVDAYESPYDNNLREESFTTFTNDAAVVNSGNM